MKRPALVTHPVFLASLLCIAIGLLQLWLITDGTWLRWPGHSSYYPALTDAFLHGQLSLRLRPPPQLLALPDPYDPVANNALRLQDAVLFNGKYYLYWGPVPAIIGAVATMAMGTSDPTYNDQQLVFAFTLATIVMALFLMWQVRSRLFPNLPPWSALPPFIGLALGAPLLNCGHVYGAAIMAGQFFLLAGFAFAWLGLFSFRNAPACILAAGLCWALSCGSRVSLPPAIAAVAGLTAWQLWRPRPDPARPCSQITSTFALALPLLAGASLMALYNFERFHSVTNFGYRYVLASVNQHDSPLSSITSPHYLLPNLARYLFEPPRWNSHFPFLWARNQASLSSLDKALALPSRYTFDPLVGLVWTQPFLSLAILGIIPLWQGSLGSTSFSVDRRFTRWLVSSLCLSAILGLLPPLSMAGSAFRYLIDAIPSLAILAAIGYFHLLTISGIWRNRIQFGCTVLVLAQCVAGILVTLNNHNVIIAFFRSL